MKIIFLDFDGVVNSRETITRNHAKGEKFGDYDRPDESLVSNINLILQNTDAMIVISSTWRLHGIMHCKEALHKAGLLPNRVLGITPSIYNANRGQEIQVWLNTCGEDIESFVILDDDSDMDELLTKLIHVDSRVGLTLENALKAIEILEKPI